jgi:hypothetical protein
MNENLCVKNENLGVNTLQTAPTPTPTIYLLGTLFTAGVVIGSILGTIITKKER